MEIYWWFMAQVVGALGTTVDIVIKELRSDRSIEFGRDTLLYYADNFLWVGLTLTVFPILDFLKKTARSESTMLYAGRVNSIILSSCMILLIVFAVLYGLVKGLDLVKELDKTYTDIFARLPSIVHDTYIYFLVSAPVFSFCYILRTQVLTSRVESTKNKGETTNEPP